MGGLWLIGDEISATGFRLAGARVLIPPAGGELKAFQQARTEADLVLITAQVAARLPADSLGDALQAAVPLILIIPDIRGTAQPADLAGRLRRQLGLAE